MKIVEWNFYNAHDGIMIRQERNCNEAKTIQYGIIEECEMAVCELQLKRNFLLKFPLN